MIDFKFFHKNQRVEGELNPNYDENLVGVVGNLKYLWRWSESEDGIRTYNPVTFDVLTIEYEIYTLNWYDFITENFGKIIYVRYIINPNNGMIIQDGLPNEWDINFNDILLIKAVVF